MEDKHTPGPWITVPRHGMGGEKTTVGSANHGAVADCGGCSVSVARDLANAHLIAAAPELLEALRDAADALEEIYKSDMEQSGEWDMLPPPQLEKARAAIAKAEGR